MIIFRKTWSAPEPVFHNRTHSLSVASQNPSPKIQGGLYDSFWQATAIAVCFLPRTAVVLAVVLGALLSATASAQTFVFSPFKDVTINANWNTGEQQSAVTGTTEAVTSAMPTDNSTLTWAFATGTCGSETWAGITPALESSNVQDFVNAGKYYIVSTGGSVTTSTAPATRGWQHSSKPTTRPTCWEWTTTSSSARGRRSLTT